MDSYINRSKINLININYNINFYSYVIAWAKDKQKHYFYIQCEWNGRCIIVKMTGLAKLIYSFNKIAIKIPGNYFIDIAKMILKFRWKVKTYNG